MHNFHNLEIFHARFLHHKFFGIQNLIQICTAHARFSQTAVFHAQFSQTAIFSCTIFTNCGFLVHDFHKLQFFHARFSQSVTFSCTIFACSANECAAQGFKYDFYQIMLTLQCSVVDKTRGYARCSLVPSLQDLEMSAALRERYSRATTLGAWVHNSVGEEGWCSFLSFCLLQYIFFTNPTTTTTMTTTIYSHKEMQSPPPLSGWVAAPSPRTSFPQLWASSSCPQLWASSSCPQLEASSPPP